MRRVANQRDCFVIKKAGITTAVLFSIQDYEDLNDLVQTALEQLDPEYQKSLKRARKEIEAGRYIRDATCGGTLSKRTLPGFVWVARGTSHPRSRWPLLEEGVHASIARVHGIGIVGAGLAMPDSV